MDHAQTIALYQPTLKQIAYNLVRSRADAEDIVQETFLKWLTIDRERIRNTQAYLVQAVRNNCLNHIKSLKRKKEEYLETINLSEFVNRVKENNFSQLDLDVDLAHAFKVMLAKLEPLERAVYLLKEVFDFDYEALQEALDKKKDHCRQLVCRARKKLSEETSRVHFDLPDVSALIASFRKACDLGNASELVQALKRDISSAGQKIS